MLTENNLVLTRAEPNGHGGVQFIYRVANYGVAAVNKPKEEIHHLNWEMDVIKFRDSCSLTFDICHNTELASRTLTFYNDKTANDFLRKAFVYLQELSTLEKMMPE